MKNVFREINDTKQLLKSSKHLTNYVIIRITLKSSILFVAFLIPNLLKAGPLQIDPVFVCRWIF